jgi:hypothetical protein
MVQGGVMKKTFAVVFGGVVACTLLLLYAATIIGMTVTVIIAGKTAPDNEIEFTDGAVLVVTMVGGLVSALVMAKLAVTDAGASPRIVISKNAVRSNLETYLSVGYLATWMAVGLGAFIVGVILLPNVNQTLHDIGATWLGLAVTSGYAYFGIEPKT